MIEVYKICMSLYKIAAVAPVSENDSQPADFDIIVNKTEFFFHVCS